MTVQCDGLPKKVYETAKEYAKDAFDYVRNNPAKALLVAELLSGGGVSATAGGTTGLMTPAAAAVGDTFVKTTVAVLGTAFIVEDVNLYINSITRASEGQKDLITVDTSVGIETGADAIEK